jgi:hypothetical protein
MKRKTPPRPKAAKEDLLSCGFDVLNHLLLGSPSRGLTHVAAEMGLAKSTTHRILKILMRHVAGTEGITAATVSDTLDDEDRCRASTAPRTGPASPH